MGVLTKIITVKKIIGCGDNPVYLCWLNALGGFDYWLFNKFQEQEIDTKIETAFDLNITDLETSLGSSDITGKSTGQEIDVVSRIELEDMSGIQSLYNSTSVFMLANPLTWEVDGVKWKKVIVKPGSLKVFKTNTNYYDVKISLVLPDLFTQQQ